MNAKEKFLKIFESVSKVLVPEHACMACGREIPDGTKFFVCEDCKSKIEWLNSNTCAKCGDLLLGDSLVCDHCKNFEYAFNRNISRCYYGEKSAAIVKGLKYSGRKYYAKHIAEILATSKADFDGIDCLTFVPISKKRKRERGFNQAEEIAKCLSNIVGVPVMYLLEKPEDGKHQAGLSRAERMKNLSNSFSVAPDAESFVKGKSIMIVDDVFTTGTTLNECSKVLKKLKPKRILTMTFAKTKFDDISL